MRKVYCKLAVLIKEKDTRLTQSGLAQETELAISTVRRLHNNEFSRVDLGTIETLCDYFHCEVSDLFELRNEE